MVVGKDYPFQLGPLAATGVDRFQMALSQEIPILASSSHALGSRTIAMVVAGNFQYYVLGFKVKETRSTS